MSDVLNLDARRAEVLHTPKQVQLAGIVYDLPAELPLVFGELLAQTKFRDAIALLFGDATDTVCGLLTQDDLLAICQELYGVTAPE